LIDLLASVFRKLKTINLEKRFEKKEKTTGKWQKEELVAERRGREGKAGEIPFCWKGFFGGEKEFLVICRFLALFAFRSGRKTRRERKKGFSKKLSG